MGDDVLISLVRGDVPSPMAQHYAGPPRRSKGKRGYLRTAVCCGIGIGIGVLGIYGFMVYSTIFPMQQPSIRHHAAVRRDPTDKTAIARRASRREALAVRWEMECGCTGMEVEAFNLLQPLLVDPAYRMMTNKCDSLCKGYRASEAHLLLPLFRAPRTPSPGPQTAR